MTGYRVIRCVKGFIVVLGLFLIGSTSTFGKIEKPSLRFAHVQAVNIKTNEADIVWVTDLTASTEVHYGISKDAVNLVASSSEGEIHRVTLTNLIANTTYYFEVVSNGVTDNNHGKYYQFHTAQSDKKQGSHMLYGFVKDAQGKPVQGALVLLTVNGSLPLAYYPTGANGDWAVNLEELRDASTYQSQAYANGDVVQIWAYGPDQSDVAGYGWASQGVIRHTLATVGAGMEPVADIIVQAPDAALPVTLASFVGRYDGQAILLEWSTFSESENLGWHVYRATTAAGPYERVTEHLLPGNGTTVLLHRYQFTDESVVPDRHYYYYLVSVDYSGRETRSYRIEVPTFGERVSHLAVPQETALLPNYPNPFNPETWIPFQLAEAAEVEIRIYDVSGRLVRRLELGHLAAGYYVDRDSAAHWDGRNAAGESVVSGLYFVQLVTPTFHQMRRMVVVR